MQSATTEAAAPHPTRAAAAEPAAAPAPAARVDDGLDEFRIHDAFEVAAMLRRLCEGELPVSLHAPNGGASLGATLWTADPERRTLGFAVDIDDPALPLLIEARTLAVVGNVDSIRVQFDVAEAVLVRGASTSVLSCAFPRELFRFQRRNAFRVRPPLRATPIARVRHTDIAEMQLALRVVDLSIGGCALFLPHDVPPMQIGGVLNRVRIELDEATVLQVDLRLQHVTSLGEASGGVRLGCEFVQIDPEPMRALQRFIDQAQKRGRLADAD